MKPIGMDPRKSFHSYPRRDNIYTHKSSLNFDMMRAKIFEDRKVKGTEAYIWLAHAIIGFLVGTIAFFLTLLEDNSAKYRSKTI